MLHVLVLVVVYRGKATKVAVVVAAATAAKASSFATIPHPFSQETVWRKGTFLPPPPTFACCQHETWVSGMQRGACMVGGKEEDRVWGVVVYRSAAENVESQIIVYEYFMEQITTTFHAA